MNLSALCSSCVTTPPAHPPILCVHRQKQRLETRGGCLLTVGSSYHSEHWNNMIWHKLGNRFFSVFLFMLFTHPEIAIVNSRNSQRSNTQDIHRDYIHFEPSAESAPITFLCSISLKSKCTLKTNLSLKIVVSHPPLFCTLIYIMWAYRGQRSSPSQIPLSKDSQWAGAS